jgi:hypothetical protein
MKKMAYLIAENMAQTTLVSLPLAFVLRGLHLARMIKISQLILFRAPLSFLQPISIFWGLHYQTFYGSNCCRITLS